MTFSLLSAAILASGILIGLIPTVLDGLKKPLQDRLNLPDGRLDWLVRIFYVTWLPAMPLAGALLDSWNLSREILFFGLVGAVLGFAWLALARSATSLLLGAVFLGVAYSCVTTAGIRLMTTAFFPGDDDLPNGAALNVGFVAVGLGALVGPWIARAIAGWSGTRQGLLYLSVVCIVPATMTAICERTLFPGPLQAPAPWEDVFTHPHMALIAGVILLYFALENCLEFWPEPYLKELGYEERGVEAAMLVFWLAFIGTRAVAAWWLYEHPTHTFGLTLALLIASAIVIGNLTSRYQIGGGSLGFWLVGACYGPLLPGFLAIALDQGAGKPLSTTVLGALLALSGLDTLIVRPMMIGFGRERTARSVMGVPTVLAIILAAPLLLLAFL